MPGLAERYDDDQRRVIREDPDSRLLVVAGPGTGKTHTLVGRVGRVAGALRSGRPGPLCQVMSFTRAAVDVVRERIGRSGVGPDVARVSTFDSFCTSLLIEHGLVGPGELGAMGHVERIELATERIRGDASLLGDLRHLVVDEVQDLVGVRAELVLAMLAALPEGCGATLLGDPCQAIYDYQVADSRGPTSDAFLREAVGDGWARAELSIDHRSGGGRQGWLADELAALRGPILRGDAWEAGMRVARVMEDLASGCAVGPAAVGGSGGRVGVLARTGAGASRACALLSEAGVGCVRVARRAYSDDPETEGERSARVAVLTAHASKGREYDEVLVFEEAARELARVTALPAPEQIAEARAAYVALTRSRGATRVLACG